MSSSLDEEEVDGDQLDDDPCDVDDVQLPANRRDADGNAIGVDDHGHVQEEEVETAAFGASAVLQALHGVQSLKRRPAPGETNAEEVDADDGAVREGLMCARCCGKSSQENVRNETATQAPHEHLSAAEPVEKRRSVHGSDHGEDRVDGVDQELSRDAGDAGLLDHFRHEVADDVVAAPLAKERHEDDHRQPPSSRAGVDKLFKVPPRVLAAGCRQVLHDLGHLQRDDRSSDVSVCVVSGEDGGGLLTAILHDQPTRRFGEEQNEGHGHRGHAALDDGRDPPSPGRRSEVQVGAVCRPACEDVTEPPEVVVHAGHGASISGVSELDSVRRASSACDTGSEAQDESAPDELTHAMSRALDGSAHKDECAASENANPTTVAVSEEATEGERCDLAKVVYDEYNAGRAACAGKAEGLLVAGHGVDRAHQTAVESLSGVSTLSMPCF